MNIVLKTFHFAFEVLDYVKFLSDVYIQSSWGQKLIHIGYLKGFLFQNGTTIEQPPTIVLFVVQKFDFNGYFLEFISKFKLKYMHTPLPIYGKRCL